MGELRRTIEARRLFGFTEVVGDRYLVAATVGPELDPVLLTLEQEPSYRAGAWGWAVRPNRLRIHHRVDDGAWTALDLPETEENYHAVQPLGDGGWLLVRLRAEDDRDENAHVYDSAGRHLRSFHAGDGIRDVQATRGGDIWVSYFDEGVFSGMGLGGSGLVRLDVRGGCTLRFPGFYGGVPPDIVDCYALNVVSDREAWLYYYTDFPLVRLVDGRVDGVWPDAPVKGSPAFAVGADVVLFAGGYDCPDSLILARLGHECGLELIATDEAGRPLEGFSAIGRRDRLFLWTEEALLVVEVPDRSPGGRAV